MNENLNLLEKLKNVPVGTKLYSSVFGEVEFLGINKNEEAGFPIIIRTRNCYHRAVTKDGRYSDYPDYPDAECILFPSKDQRDWSEFEYDPIKIGTPVMVRENKWECWYLKYYNGNRECYGQTSKEYSYKWREIIPVSEFDFENLCRKVEAK